MNQKVIAVVGPTATGKTDVAIAIAKRINSEIINCDSRQVYIGMDIGTNKGYIAKMKSHFKFKKHIINAYDMESSGVRGWLFDIVRPDEVLTLSDYQQYTLKIIKRMFKQGKVPILVGGTGLYFDALIKGYKLNDVKPNPILRLKLSKLKTSKLFEKLQKLDEKKALSLNNSDAHNPRRLIRALEEALHFKKQPKKSEIEPIKLDVCIVYPKIDKTQLHEKLDARVLQMVAEGLVQETKNIINEYGSELEVLKGIGYKEVKEYLAGRINLTQMIEAIQQGHKNYVKKQITWFEGKSRNYDLKKLDFSMDPDKIFSKLMPFLI
jgi:tRNA dimethylallyltransferase